MKRTLTRTSPNGSALLRQGNGQKVLRRENGQKKQRSAESTRQHYRLFPEAVVVAAERVGKDNSGRNGLIGYLVRLARTQPRSFAALLARTPPDAVIGEKPPQQTVYVVRIFDADGTHLQTVRDGVPVVPDAPNGMSEVHSDLPELNENSGAPMKPTHPRTLPNGGALLRQGNGHKTLRRGKGQKTRPSPESARLEYGSLHEAVIVAAEQIGEDDHGRDGLIGYLVRLARTEPRAFAAFLARIPSNATIGDQDEKITLSLDIFDKKLKKTACDSCSDEEAL
jgi:hypothetical protein